MHGDAHSIIFSLFLIFSGAALLATLALFLRQAMIVAYLILGALLGPWGLALVTDAELIGDIARIGIMFLLFLLGLNLSPQKLFLLLRETTWVTLTSAAVFAGIAAGIALAFGFSGGDVFIIGVAGAFSSTIIGLKLLPTTVLHHRHTGEVIISVLLLQDLLAIVALLAVHGGGGDGDDAITGVVKLIVALPALGAVAWLGQRWLLTPLFKKFDRIQEYVFLLAIGWCLGFAQAAHAIGLSYEIGAFAAGVAIAASPIAVHIAESLKPLRDFFLILFFFALGAGFNLAAASAVIVPAVCIALALLAVKPVVFRFLLVRHAESDRLAWETGVRLGQLSEFSLLIVFVALNAGVITDAAFYTVQLATILSFIVSVYFIVLRYPTPIALNEKLRRD